MRQVYFYHRYLQREMQEQIYGGDLVSFFYQNSMGRVLERLIATPFISKFYGYTQDLSWSAKKIPSFIEKFSIPMDEYQPGSVNSADIKHTYKNFNEFFIRKFKTGVRSFENDAATLGAFAEARYSGVAAINDDTRFPVKGVHLNPIDLLQKKQWHEKFQGGPLLVARLCPVDYHRYHYPTAGKTVDSYTLSGEFHSVNPLALNFDPQIFIKNERRVSILETKDFGNLAYIEVGATCVGKIVQSFDETQPFQRGDEKGYFLFGGSTVILIGEKGSWIPSDDILKFSAQKKEVYIHLGDAIAKKC